jgi:hypothetical protein
MIQIKNRAASTYEIYKTNSTIVIILIILILNFRDIWSNFQYFLRNIIMILFVWSVSCKYQCITGQTHKFKTYTMQPELAASYKFMSFRFPIRISSILQSVLHNTHHIIKWLSHGSLIIYQAARTTNLGSSRFSHQDLPYTYTWAKWATYTWRDKHNI